MNLEEDKLLTIQLVSFYNLKEGKERYYFMEMSSLQATTLLDPDSQIEKIELFAHDLQDNYLTGSKFDNFNKLSDFNNFFLKHPEFHIHDLEMHLENDLEVSSHDDGEVSLTIKKDSNQIDFIKRILKKFGLAESLILAMKEKPNYYLEIDSNGNVVSSYATFDDYLEKGRK